MEQLILFAVAVAIGVGAAYVINRRRSDAQVATMTPLPTHANRSDFVGPGLPWVLAIFSSDTCLACADVLAHARSFESTTVAVQDIEVKAEPALHKTYNIDSVPATLVIDSDGIVQASFLGPLAPPDVDKIASLVHPGGDGYSSQE